MVGVWYMRRILPGWYGGYPSWYICPVYPGGHTTPWYIGLLPPWRYTQPAHGPDVYHAGAHGVLQCGVTRPWAHLWDIPWVREVYELKVRHSC